MKRTNSLIASIMGAVVHGIQVVLNLIAMFGLFAILAGTGAASAVPNIVVFVLALYIVLELFLIVAFVLTCVTFSYVNGTPEKYAKKKSITITTIVFNFIVAILFFIACSGSNAASIVFFIICAIALVAANVLYIVDLSKEKQRVETQAEQTVEQVPTDESSK